MRIFLSRNVLFFAIVLFTSSTIFAQAESEQDIIITPASYEKIMLDGKAAYLDSESKNILTPREYFIAMKDTASIAIEITHDYWDTLKVNPYRGLKLERPFIVKFDDLEYHPPIDKDMYITSRFGRRRRGPHRGIDIDLHTGENVRVMFDGEVRFVGYSRGHGKTVVIRHANDLETVYAHLSAYNVKVNEVVSKGQILGLGGATGNARGSHLHLEIRYKGVCIHPEYLLDFKNASIVRAPEYWVTKGWVNPLNHTSYRKSKVAVLESREMALAYQKTEKRIHVVRSGDTLSTIARKNGMRIKDIVSLNSVTTRSVLRIGQHLVICP